MKREPKYTRDYEIAHHEAAHAVMRIALGLTVKSIEISDPATGRGGYMETFDDRCPPWNLSAMLLGTLASIPAEQLLHPRYPTLGLIMPGGPCEDDWNDAVHIVGLIHGDADSLDKYLRRASKLVRRLAPVIHAVAVELERNRKLEYVDIWNLIPVEVRTNGIQDHHKRIESYSISSQTDCP